ncbi:MAG: trypsin-like peptidase domain-containing protein [Pseudomonadales bacterium]|nr:trypsin-like peptidase domain-containing protein [Pseudomonadales bacterium]
MTSWLLAMVLWLLTPLIVTAQPNDQARDLFASTEASVFQVRVIDKSTNNKSSTGSGFLIEESGILATNYHVVSSVVDKPEKYRVEILLKDEQPVEATIITLDIVHDLALLQTRPLDAPVLPLAQQEPAKGETVYSIGFPYDLGITVIAGTWNGLAPHSASPRVHFSGSLNPGMSGGPAFNNANEIIGVNVSTAGNQMSFLVPVQSLRELFDNRPAEPLTSFNELIARQLTANNKRLMDEMMAGDWSTVPLAGAHALGEVTGFLRCWGNSKDESNKQDNRPFFATRSCQTDHNISVTSQFFTGKFELQFYWIESDELSPTRFYDYYENVYSQYRPGNAGTKRDLGPWRCEEDFVIAGHTKTERTKTVFCTRAYKKFTGLYDVMFLQGSVDREQQAFMSHFTLSGTTREQALRFTAQFMESGVW